MILFQDNETTLYDNIYIYIYNFAFVKTIDFYSTKSETMHAKLKKKQKVGESQKGIQTVTILSVLQMYATASLEDVREKETDLNNFGSERNM